MKTQNTIRNCPPEFRDACSKKWDDLQPTDDPDVRHCTLCSQSVYFCKTDQETIDHARAGHCIARLTPDSSELPPKISAFGRTNKVFEAPKPSASQLEAQAWAMRESGITDFVQDTSVAGRNCPSCGFPVPGARKRCHVCKMEIGRAVN
jgi:hypothetical protein